MRIFIIYILRKVNINLIATYQPAQQRGYLLSV